ncbi:MAG: antibiotic biosynthesis monooxygenase [Metallosphaera sp.]
MINVGFYYKVKKGHEKEFEETFLSVLKTLKESLPGFRDAKLYKNVADPQEYLIYSEWDNLETFREFIKSRAFKETTSYGKSIIDGRPTHRVLQQVDES